MPVAAVCIGLIDEDWAVSVADVAELDELCVLLLVALVDGEGDVTENTDEPPDITDVDVAYDDNDGGDVDDAGDGDRDDDDVETKERRPSG